ncbi:MAG: threonine--tRNA ligase, partial [bacterium]
MEIAITLPDGSKMNVAKDSTVQQIAERIGAGLARAALAGKVNGRKVDLVTPVNEDAQVEILTASSPEGLEILRHSCAHLMAQAIKHVFPEARLEDGPPTDDGFWYDIHTERPIATEDFPAIEKEMQKIAQSKIPVRRREFSRDEALELFKKRGEDFKLDIIRAIPDGDTISTYEQGDFIDLCRGPHVPHTGVFKAFKLMSVAGAYLKGDANNLQLTRVRGTVFPSKKELDEYLRLLEEAKRRDHRRIGKDMDLFSFQEEGPGFPFFHPKGTILFNSLVGFCREELAKLNYVEIKTPLILNEDLWHRSGHWDHYKENMYFTQIDERNFAVKPMNCPGCLLVYRSGHRSYRDLPVKIAEFGIVHRHELSGVLHGLFRVRTFTQDDAHIFCLPEQLEDEIQELIELIFHIYNTFGFEDVHIELSTQPEKSIGSSEMWEQATNALRNTLDRMGIKYKLNPGEGAFYGPKIDFHIKDCLGRSWQCATVQVDFSMPERFDLNYIGNDGNRHRPAMIHRAIFGSLERFMGILIEHYAGDFPLWLAPTQATVLSIGAKHHDYANKVTETLKSNGIRAESNTGDETIGHKIRDAELLKIP